MDDITSLPFSSFLDRLAERSPTPGGGAAAAAGGALACAMGRMVAVYSVNAKTAAGVRARVEEVQKRLHRADTMLRQLIGEDAVAYEQLTKAAADLRTAKRDTADAAALAQAESAHAAAIAAALSVPLEMAAILAEALETLDGFKDLASRFLLSDLAVAGVLAAGSARAARYMVLVNAGEVADESSRRSVLESADAILARCERHRGAIETFVSERLDVCP